MRAFKDDRGRSYNDVFPAVGVGDVNVSILYPGTIKAFHRHAKQDDHWFLAKGNVRVVVVEELPTTNKIYVSDWEDDSRYSDGSTVVLPRGAAAYKKYAVKQGTQAEERMLDNGTWRVLQRRYYNVTTGVEPRVSVHYLSEGESLVIPKGLWHGVQALEESILLYHITNKYNPEDPDEERAPWDKFYSWEVTRK